MKVQKKPGPVIDAFVFDPSNPPSFCQEMPRNRGVWGVQVLPNRADQVQRVEPGQVILCPPDGPRAVVTPRQFAEDYKEVGEAKTAKKKATRKPRAKVAAVTRPGVTESEIKAEQALSQPSLLEDE